MKLGLVLLGLSFTSEECNFQHKVALFARGFQLIAKMCVYRLNNGEGIAQVKDMIKFSLEKVSAAGNQSFATETNIADSSRSKSVIQIPTEDSVQKTILGASKLIEQSGEIEDIIKAAAQAEEKKVEPVIEAKPAAVIKPVELKPVEVKPIEVKPAELKAAEIKPSEVKPADVKTLEVKPVEAKPVESKPPVDDDYDEDFE